MRVAAAVVLLATGATAQFDFAAPGASLLPYGYTNRSSDYGKEDIICDVNATGCLNPDGSAKVFCPIVGGVEQPTTVGGVAGDCCPLGCCCATGKTSQNTDCSDAQKLVCMKNKFVMDAYKKADKDLDTFGADGTQLWVLIAGFLVFFMQCGFAMLEAGAVRSDNTQNIIFKNLMDACIAAVGWFVLGYGFTGLGGNATYSKNGFIGKNNFFLMREDNDESGQYLWYFQFAFAATAATIVSGAVAERTQLIAYFIYSAFITMWVYPVVVSWVWSAEGWLSAFHSDVPQVGKLGMLDYAGSGVVHMTGGFAGLMGAYFVGPRRGRFPDVRIDPKEACLPGFPGAESVEATTADFEGVKQSAASSSLLSAIGVFILWFGWYGFNCGSTLAWDGNNAGKVSVTTTLSAASASLTVVLIHKARTSADFYKFLARVLPCVGECEDGKSMNCGSFMHCGFCSIFCSCFLFPALPFYFLTAPDKDALRKMDPRGEWSVLQALNGVLAGLVSITAGCSVVRELSAFFIGVIGGIVYYLAQILLEYWRIDDPLNAFPVHGACGVWGCLAVGIFAQWQNIAQAYGTFDNTKDAQREVFDGDQFAVQLLGVTCIAGWVIGNTGLLFWGLNFLGLLRVSKEEETRGLDAVHHNLSTEQGQTSFLAVGAATVQEEKQEK